MFEVLSETILITLVEASSSDKIASGVPKFSDEPYSIFCETSHVKVRLHAKQKINPPNWGKNRPTPCLSGLCILKKF